VISGVELLDDDIDDDAGTDAGGTSEWVSGGDDEFSGLSSPPTDASSSSSSTLSVSFHCYHSLPSAHWSDDHTQVYTVYCNRDVTDSDSESESDGIRHFFT